MEYKISTPPKKHTFENLSRLEKQKPEITEPIIYRLFYRLYMASPICVNHGSASRFADSAQFLCKILTLSKNYKSIFCGAKSEKLPQIIAGVLVSYF